MTPFIEDAQKHPLSEKAATLAFFIFCLWHDKDSTILKRGIGVDFDENERLLNFLQASGASNLSPFIFGDEFSSICTGQELPLESVCDEDAVGSSTSSIQLLLDARKNTSVALSVAYGRRPQRPMEEPAIQPPSGQLPYVYDVDTMAIHALPDKVTPILSSDACRTAERENVHIKLGLTVIRDSEKLRWLRARDLAWKRVAKKIQAERARLTILSKELTEVMYRPQSEWPATSVAMD